MMKYLEQYIVLGEMLMNGEQIIAAVPCLFKSASLLDSQKMMSGYAAIMADYFSNLRR